MALGPSARTRSCGQREKRAGTTGSCIRKKVIWDTNHFVYRAKLSPGVSWRTMPSSSSTSKLRPNAQEKAWPEKQLVANPADLTAAFQLKQPDGPVTMSTVIRTKITRRIDTSWQGGSASSKAKTRMPDASSRHECTTGRKCTWALLIFSVLGPVYLLAPVDLTRFICAFVVFWSWALVTFCPAYYFGTWALGP